MPLYVDYIPKGDGKLQIFAMNLVKYAQKNHEKWKIPSPVEFLELVITEFAAAKVKFEEPNHGKIDTKNKNDAKARLIRALRAYIQGYIARNPLVTDEDRKNMSLHLRDRKPTAHPTPEEMSNTEAIPQGTGAHRITAINQATGDKSKPRLVRGVVFARRLRDPKDPVSRSDDMPSDVQRGTTRVYQYAETEYGKMADYATSYINNSGKRGPWSNVTSLLISG